MALAIFDLDNTLIAGDSDHLWGTFMIDLGVVDPIQFKEQNDQFYKDYQGGQLDIMAYQHFALSPIAKRPMTELNRWHQQFMRDYIEPRYLTKAQALVDKHKQQGDTVMVITATNSFITRPIAKRYGIDILLGTDPQINNGVFTGEVDGIPTFQQGKVERLNLWLKEHNQTLKGSYFYSDSHNDLPLLKQVDNPTVVDADEKLTQVAIEKNWPQLSLR